MRDLLLGEEVEVLLNINGRDVRMRSIINSYDCESERYVCLFSLEVNKEEIIKRGTKNNRHRIIKHEDFNPSASKFYVDEILGINESCQLLSYDEYDNGLKESKIRYSDKYEIERLKIVNDENLYTSYLKSRTFEEEKKEENDNRNRISSHKDFNPPWYRFYVDRELGIDLTCEVLSVDNYEDGRKVFNIRYRDKRNKEITKMVNSDKILTIPQHMKLIKSYDGGEEKKEDNIKRILKHEDFNPPITRFYVEEEKGIDAECQVLSYDEYEDGRKECRIKYKDDLSHEIIKRVNRDRLLTHSQHSSLTDTYKEGEEVEAKIIADRKIQWKKVKIAKYDESKKMYMVENGKESRYVKPENIRRVNPKFAIGDVIAMKKDRFEWVAGIIENIDTENKKYEIYTESERKSYERKEEDISKYYGIGEKVSVYSINNGRCEYTKGRITDYYHFENASLDKIPVSQIKPINEEDHYDIKVDKTSKYYGNELKEEYITCFLRKFHKYKDGRREYLIRFMREEKNVISRTVDISKIKIHNID